MAAKNGKLRIMKIGGGGEYFVEGTGEKALCYRVALNEGDHPVCSCGDYSIESKKTPAYRCEHIDLVLNGNGNLQWLETSEEKKPKLDERFFSNIQGKDFVLYAGLLDLAHQKGLKGLHVAVIQLPTKENGMEAVCSAVVESDDGKLFVELGDANPGNVNPKIARHIIRMAATRAKARAMRDFTNIGVTCVEELGGMDEVGDEAPPLVRREAKTEQVEPKSPPKEPKKAGNNGKPSNGNGKAKVENEPKKEEPKKDPSAKASSAQLQAIENLVRRRGMTMEEMKDLALNTFGRRELESLTALEASSFIRTLQQSA